MEIVENLSYLLTDPNRFFEKAVLEEHNLKNLMGLMTLLQGRIIDFLI